MTGGMLHGGWEYVWAAYALTTVTLVGYAVILGLRLRRARAARSPEESR